MLPWLWIVICCLVVSNLFLWVQLLSVNKTLMHICVVVEQNIKATANIIKALFKKR